MKRQLFRLVPLRKGHGGQGYTYYAVMQVSTGKFMSRSGSFRATDIYSDLAVHFNTEEVAVTHATAHGYVLDTEGQLLVRMSTDGVELASELNRLYGAFFKLRGELVRQGGATADGALNFTIPANVKAVGLYHSQKYGWMLCEEDPVSREQAGFAWLPNKTWPANIVYVIT